MKRYEFMYPEQHLINDTLKEYSEISGRLKHPDSLTSIDRYSFKKLMSKIPVGYDFTLARYKIFKKCKDLPILSKLFCSAEVLLK